MLYVIFYPFPWKSQIGARLLFAGDRLQSQNGFGWLCNRVILISDIDFITRQFVVFEIRHCKTNRFVRDLKTKLYVQKKISSAKIFSGRIILGVSFCLWPTELLHKNARLGWAEHEVGPPVGIFLIFFFSFRAQTTREILSSQILRRVHQKNEWADFAYTTRPIRVKTRKRSVYHIQIKIFVKKIIIIITTTMNNLIIWYWVCVPGRRSFSRKRVAVRTFCCIVCYVQRLYITYQVKIIISGDTRVPDRTRLIICILSCVVTVTYSFVSYYWVFTISKYP